MGRRRKDVAGEIPAAVSGRSARCQNRNGPSQHGPHRIRVCPKARTPAYATASCKGHHTSPGAVRLPTNLISFLRASPRQVPFTNHPRQFECSAVDWLIDRRSALITVPCELASSWTMWPEMVSARSSVLCAMISGRLWKPLATPRHVCTTGNSLEGFGI